MENNIIGRKERIILVQVDLDKEEGERVIAKNLYGGGYSAFQSPDQATSFEDEEKAKKISKALNSLYELSGDQYRVRIAREVINREFIDELEEDSEEE
ncbi:hypothetical protein MUA90_10690 [Staphylococcus sp. IVB6181]|uniref:hypothetical protein n=1 Tax=Staphylococcus sp. IVB6181 TaxID=2929481 RepID=UPI0021D347CB|nr:hypothetical protein [Staphylococcus sp. IVB6181]UXV34483.1 hypothetical protein MUA90_10690 [Staphylococcus sp. IVB6181]